MSFTDSRIIRHGAYGILLREGKKILLTQKKSGPYKELWGLPGGKIEFGETPEQTLKRELLEETSLTCGFLEFLNILTATGEYLQEGVPYEFHQVGLIYKVLNWTKQVTQVPEEETHWFFLNDIKMKELTPFAKEAIRILSKGKT